MIYKAVEVIWIFSVGGRDGWTGIEGILRGPRGPKNKNDRPGDDGMLRSM